MHIICSVFNLLPLNSHQGLTPFQSSLVRFVKPSLFLTGSSFNLDILDVSFYLYQGTPRKHHLSYHYHQETHLFLGRELCTQHITSMWDAFLFIGRYFEIFTEFLKSYMIPNSPSVMSSPTEKKWLHWNEIYKLRLVSLIKLIVKCKSCDSIPEKVIWMSVLKYVTFLYPSPSFVMGRDYTVPTEWDGARRWRRHCVSVRQL